MGIYSRLSVAHKIRVMIVLTAATALLLASLLFISLEVMSARKALQERVQLLAEIVATHVTAALSFEDPDTATRLLGSLELEADIIAAVILDEQDQPFALYQQTRNKPSALKGQVESTPQISEMKQVLASSSLTQPGFHTPHFTTRSLEVTAPINLDGDRIGTLYIRASLDGLWKQIIFYLTVVVLILGLTLLLVYYLAQHLHQRISAPIETLLRGMKTISEEQNYATRIESADSDEIGEIIDGFNDMITQIDKRDQKIQQKSQEVEQHAFFDALTGLPNRRLLMQHLERELERARRDNGIGALMYLDLDHFKIINDSLGHNTGDGLLMHVAKRLKDTLRSSDTSARVGGDEFVVILSNLDSDQESAANRALLVAESLRRNISRPYEIEGRALHTSPSIGITLFDRNNSNAENIVKQADLAMYQAKEDGRNLVQFFAEDMQQKAMLRLQIEQDLRYALESDLNQLELFFQPQVNHQGEIIGAETLLRWHHPEQHDISPALFVPVAEVTGLIHPLGQWVLHQACIQLASWQRQGLRLQLAVNVSPNEFLHAEFTDSVLQIVEQTGIDPSWLELEVTEGVILRDVEEVIRIMKQLKNAGIQFAVDDFGTGYSSLQYLKMLPISKLKIDQSFVRDIMTDPNDAAIVATIIAMSKHLDLNVIAEGVETTHERDFLYDHGCDLFQGYLFSKPLPLNNFEQRLEQQNLRRALGQTP